MTIYYEYRGVLYTASSMTEARKEAIKMDSQYSQNFLCRIFKTKPTRKTRPVQGVLYEPLFGRYTAFNFKNTYAVNKDGTLGRKLGFKDLVIGEKKRRD